MIVVGNKWKWEELAAVPAPCPSCGKEPTTLCLGRNRATVYYVPLFTFKQSYGLFCQACNDHYLVEEAKAKALLSSGVQPTASLAESAISPAAPVESVAEEVGDQPPSAPPPTCSSCGQSVSANAKFCASCGSKLPAGPPLCRSCGTEVKGRFCAECGTPVAPVTQAPATSASGTVG